MERSEKTKLQAILRDLKGHQRDLQGLQHAGLVPQRLMGVDISYALDKFLEDAEAAELKQASKDAERKELTDLIRAVIRQEFGPRGGL